MPTSTRKNTTGKASPREAFTFIELLVVASILATLMALLLPVLFGAVERGRRVACASNLRQLYLANDLYAVDRRRYVAAASDILRGNLRRWHGERAHVMQPFDGSKGPLVPYLGDGREIRRCPSFRGYRVAAAENAFETSCGGFGYNAVGVGSETYPRGYTAEAMERGMAPSALRNPGTTLMFTDCAFPQPYGGNPTYLIEYSFAEPYHFVFEPETESSVRASPSIHFRHRDRANAVWCDGRVSSETLDAHAAAHFTRWKIGWFGPPNNSLFAP